MRIRTSALVLAGAALFAGCGEQERSAAASAPAKSTSAPAKSAVAQSSAAARGTRIVVRGSQFGRMLFNGRRQAIYIFQRDGRRKTNCYGECAEAWPPVYTQGHPRAGAGVRKSLLGTITRRDGRRQVTYAGQPLYYYAHEGPGQVLCHNVNLNGGLWWVVGPDGRRRP